MCVSCVWVRQVPERRASGVNIVLTKNMIYDCDFDGLYSTVRVDESQDTTVH